MMTPPRKILITVLDNLGDTVMATAILWPLKKIFPQSAIGMFVKSYVAEILADQSLVEKVHAADPFWDVSPGRGRGSVGDFVETIFDIRREGYDVAVVLNAEWRRAAAIRLTGIPVRIGFDRRRAQTFLTQPVPERVAGPHFIDAHRAIVRAFAGGQADSEEFLPRLEVAEGDMAWWEAWSGRARMRAGEYAVVHPFSGDDRKNWPLASWAALLQRLHAQGFRFVVVCSAAEKHRLAPLAKAVPADALHVMAGAPLRHAKAVISRAKVLVGGDSGPGHIAAALGVPVVSLFGPGTPARSGPMGRASVRFLTNNPLSSLDVDSVETAVLESVS